jgi:hypothetical protein
MAFPLNLQQFSVSLDTECQAINEYLQTKSILWLFPIVMLLFGIPFLLFLFHYAIITEVIPASFSLGHFYLNIDQPSFSSLFFSNYVHNVFDSGHITNNMQGHLVVFFLLVFLYLIYLPAKGYDCPEENFYLTTIIFLALVPFAVSGVSILFGRFLGIGWAQGFSGINWAFTGYLIYVIVRYSIEAGGRKTAEKEHRTLDQTDEAAARNATFPFFFFTIAFILLVCVFAILLDFGRAQINVFGHLIGFAMGILVPSLVDSARLVRRDNVQGQMVVLVALLLVIGVPAVAWAIV